MMGKEWRTFSNLPFLKVNFAAVEAQKAIGNGKENKLEKYKFTEVEMLEKRKQAS